MNPNAIHLLRNNLEKVNWNELSDNPSAISLLEDNKDKINWICLSSNPNAMHLFKQNPDKIVWCELSTNPSIFTIGYDYLFLKGRMDIIREELIKKCMHPRRLEQWIEMGGDFDDF